MESQQSPPPKGAEQYIANPPPSPSSPSFSVDLGKGEQVTKRLNLVLQIAEGLGVAGKNAVEAFAAVLKHVAGQQEGKK